jgi:hypothetical protein
MLLTTFCILLNEGRSKFACTIPAIFFYYMTIIMEADVDWISGRKYAKMKAD